jgi:biotin carboxylase
MLKILILGGNRYNVLAIQSIKDKALYTICIDRDKNAEAKQYADEFYDVDFSDKERVYQLAKSKNINAIIPTNDRGVISAAYASNKLGLKFISEDVAEVATNKYKMRKIWSENNVDTPWFLSISELTDINVEELRFPCIFKPQDSKVAGSRGVKVVYEKCDIKNAFEFAKKYSHQVLIEELLIGKEHSVEVLIENGNYNILAISDKVKTPYPYRVDKEVIYPTDLTGHKLVHLKEAIIKSIKVLGIDIGAAHLEMCTTNDGRYVPFEVGARCGGGGTPNPIIKYVTGIDMIVELCMILLGKESLAHLEKEIIHKNCVYHFITPKSGIVKSINTDLLKNNSVILDYDVFLKEGDLAKEVKEGPDRAGFIIYKDRHFNSENIIEVV